MLASFLLSAAPKDAAFSLALALDKNTITICWVLPSTPPRPGESKITIVLQIQLNTNLS